MKAPRVRFRLLLLLWAWAGCVFLTLDLFLNVEEFDAVRPRATLYRGMRVAAHRMVGERCDGAFDESPARTRRAPRRSSAVPEAEPEDVSGVILAGTDSGAALAEYGMAAADRAARLHAEEPARARELALAALDAQAKQLARDPARLRAGAWRAARITLERIAWAMPGVAGEPEYTARLRGVRDAVAERLAVSGSVTATDADVEALGVAAHVADERTADLCVRWLRAVPFPERTREEHLACHAALRVVARTGNVHHRKEVEALLAQAMKEARDPARQRLLHDYQALLRRRDGTSPPGSAPMRSTSASRYSR
ncbi:MAG: hypothetical protein ACYTG6_11790 [Planctomycetota bacterium]|jgi:hypothetical protein